MCCLAGIVPCLLVILDIRVPNSLTKRRISDIGWTSELFSHDRGWCLLHVQLIQLTKRLKKNEVLMDGILAAVGNTPLVKIKSLSDATGCEVSTTETHNIRRSVWFPRSCSSLSMLYVILISHASRGDACKGCSFHVTFFSSYELFRSQVLE